MFSLTAPFREATLLRLEADALRELFRATALLGVKHMLKLGRGYKLGWEEMIRGYFSTRVMHALLNTGVIDEMLSKGSLDVEEFATKNRLDPQILEALCQALYSIRIFEIERGRYTLDRKGRLIVEVINLDIDAEQIDPAASLFGEGLGLDSIDLLEIALAVSQKYGFSLRSDDPDNQRIFSSLRNLSAHIAQHRAR